MNEIHFYQQLKITKKTQMIKYKTCSTQLTQTYPCLLEFGTRRDCIKGLHKLVTDGCTCAAELKI